jgi:hypothetical protein
MIVCGGALLHDIQVELRPFTDRGRLLYHADWEMRERVFYLKSATFRQQHFQVATNDPILFSLDDDGLLVAVEFVIPRSVWQVRNESKKPLGAPAFNIAFSQTSIQHQSFDLFADVITDASFSYADIRFGMNEQPAHWITLSEHCFALIADDRLKGFHILFTM